TVRQPTGWGGVLGHGEFLGEKGGYGSRSRGGNKRRAAVACVTRTDLVRLRRNARAGSVHGRPHIKLRPSRPFTPKTGESSVRQVSSQQRQLPAGGVGAVAAARSALYVMLRQVPNIISLMRLLLVPPVVLAI